MIESTDTADVIAEFPYYSVYFKAGQTVATLGVGGGFPYYSVYFKAGVER